MTTNSFGHEGNNPEVSDEELLLKLDAGLRTITEQLGRHCLTRSRNLQNIDMNAGSKQCGFDLWAVIEFWRADELADSLCIDEESAVVATAGRNRLRLPLRLVTPHELRHWEGQVDHVNRRPGPAYGQPICWLLHRLYGRRVDGGDECPMNLIRAIRTIDVSLITEQRFSFDLSANAWTRYAWHPVAGQGSDFFDDRLTDLCPDY